MTINTITQVYDSFEIFTDAGISPAAAEIEVLDNERGFSVNISASKHAIKRVVLSWNVDFEPDAKVLGDHWERGYGDLEWRSISEQRINPWYVLVHLPSSGKTVGIGVATGANCFASWSIDQNSVALNLDLSNGTGGVKLGQRVIQAVTICTLESHDGETAFDFAHRFCQLLCKKPRLPKFPVYGGNDWYYAYGNNSQESILRDSALIRELSPSTTNAPFMVIDAGWFPAKGCAGGPYDQGNDLFPDMAGLASKIDAMDVRPGIWIRPLLTATASDAIKLPSGHPIYALEKGAVLDPSVPEALAIIRADISRLVNWGYTLIKHDFTTFDLTGRWGFEMMNGEITSGNWCFADQSRTTAEIINDLYSAIRDAASSAILIGCNTVGHLGAGHFELQRTGDDTSGKEWDRTRKMGVNTLAFRMPQHDAFFAVDADCVGLTNDIPWHVNRQWLDLLAHSGTPLFVSADPNAVGPEQCKALRDAFVLASTSLPVAEPLDWMTNLCPRQWAANGEHLEFDWDEK